MPDRSPELRTVVRFRLPPGLEDEVVARLVAAGTLGWQTTDEPAGWQRVEADFAQDAGDELETLVDTLRRNWPATEPLLSRREPQPDWIAESARGLEPFPVGRRLWVDPSPEGDPTSPPDGRMRIRVPPERAFGTGTHESTRLLLELLDDEPPNGDDVLDVGTGSGILALAAVLLGARRAIAFDLDAEAVFCARRNGFAVGAAGAAVHLFAGTLDATFPRPGPLVLANIVPEVLVSLMPGLAARVAPGGRLLLAGILREAGDEVAAAARREGLVERARPGRGDWVALDVRRP